MFNLLASELHLPSSLPEQAQFAEQTAMYSCSQLYLPKQSHTALAALRQASFCTM